MAFFPFNPDNLVLLIDFQSISGLLVLVLYLQANSLKDVWFCTRWRVSRLGIASRLSHLFLHVRHRIQHCLQEMFFRSTYGKKSHLAVGIIFIWYYNQTAIKTIIVVCELSKIFFYKLQFIFFWVFFRFPQFSSPFRRQNRPGVKKPMEVASNEGGGTAEKTPGHYRRQGRRVPKLVL